MWNPTVPMNLIQAVSEVRCQGFKVGWLDGRAMLPDDLLGLIRFLIPETSFLICRLGDGQFTITNPSGCQWKLPLISPAPAEG